jgi:hypothetical protein
LAIDKPGEGPCACFAGHNLGAYPTVPIVVLAAIPAADAVFDLDQITRLEIRLNAARCRRHRRVPYVVAMLIQSVVVACQMGSQAIFAPATAQLAEERVVER